MRNENCPLNLAMPRGLDKISFGAVVGDRKPNRDSRGGLEEIRQRQHVEIILSAGFAGKGSEELGYWRKS